MFRIAVVGRGLIGSAAARYLAEGTDGVVCIGPDEPKKRDSHSGVFASHYDEGRMTRHVDPRAEWGITASKSIARYRELDRRSGVTFYSPVGYLGLGVPGSQYNALCAAMGEQNGAAIQRLEVDQIKARYPYLSVADYADGLLETGGAGYISPRRMVSAQTILAQEAGAACIKQAARAIRPTSRGVEIELWDGTTVEAERVLIAAGAFTAPLGLSPVDLGLTVYGRTVVLAQIEGDAAEILKDMPTMIDTGIGAYILPPIKYPDGRSYLKIGVGDTSDPQFADVAGLQDWFKGGGLQTNKSRFIARLKELIPVLETCPSWKTDTCAVTATKSGLPIIDTVVADKIVVAVGGCGKGAKGADEWGRIAAGVVRGLPWSSEVEREKLAIPQSDVKVQLDDVQTA
ncbi:MAG: FAD-binding oxidoreductase [Pseudomonadota bacterium]